VYLVKQIGVGARQEKAANALSVADSGGDVKRTVTSLNETRNIHVSRDI